MGFAEDGSVEVELALQAEGVGDEGGHCVCVGVEDCEAEGGAVRSVLLGGFWLEHWFG